MQGFDPDKFSFNDYKTHDSLKSTIQKLFPLGTSKEFVERVLITAGGVEQYGCNDWDNFCSYYYPSYVQDMKGGARIDIIFDKNNHLIGGAFHPNFKEILEKHDFQIREEKN